MQKITIFTDGASRGNPGPGGWGSIVILPAGKITMRNKELRIKNQEWVQELGSGVERTTNNRMELTALIKALEFVKKLQVKSYRLKVYLDSSYVLNGAGTWVHGWVKSKWKTKTKKKVENQDLWRRFLKVSKGLKIEWKLLPGHSGIAANERCDEIATMFADLPAGRAGGKRSKLYSGFLKKYGIDISASTILKRSTFHAPRSTKKAYSYVSLVNGIIKTYKTWAECEKRVKGVSGAKFKKTFSLEEENDTIETWKKELRS
ncbi:ribonuclease HI [Patescibacteria group bacterium]|nr:MAG: ribonuclease HI [Patescibacteria group bacterium]